MSGLLSSALNPSHQGTPARGRAQQTTLSGDASLGSYPSADYSATLSLPSNKESHLLIESFPASCDTLEVRRSGTGEVLWSWPYDSGSAWTPALSGDLHVGIRARRVSSRRSSTKHRHQHDHMP